MDEDDETYHVTVSDENGVKASDPNRYVLAHVSLLDVCDLPFLANATK